MKFYIPYYPESLTPDEETQVVTRQHNAYAAYLDTIRERLPASLRYIAEKIHFGDHLLQELTVDLPAATVSLRIMGQTVTHLSEEKTLQLRFGGVARCAVTNAVSPRLFGSKSLEGEMHEVELIEPDMFEFRLRFHGGAEIALRFREFDFEIIPDEYGSIGLSPEVAEEVANVATAIGQGKLETDVVRNLFAKCSDGNGNVQYQLGRMALDGGYYPLAVEQFTRASEKTAHYNLATLFYLAKARFHMQDYTGAFPLIDELLRESPRHPGALLYRVYLLGATEQWEQLAAFCTGDVLTVSGEVRLWQALALANTNQLDEARSIYQSISKRIRNRNAALNKRVLSIVG
jgi:tetratricopeptide (TPR) repeat protein